MAIRNIPKQMVHLQIILEEKWQEKSQQEGVRRCKDNWKRQGFLVEMSKWLYIRKIHICIHSAHGQLR